MFEFMNFRKEKTAVLPGKPIMTVDAAVMREPVLRAKATARKEPISLTDEQINEEILRLDQERKQLLPVESQGHQIIDEAQTKLRQMRYARVWPRLDMSILSWRRSDGWPTLAVFAPDSQTCRMRVHYNWLRTKGTADNVPSVMSACEWNTSPYMPSTMMKHYSDLLPKLAKAIIENGNHRERDVTVEIASHFPGLIPADKREKIKEFTTLGLPGRTGRAFEQIYLISDAPEWQLGIVVAPQPKDPLIVGYANDQFWFLDSFDTTSAEDLIKAEWMTGPDK